MLKRQSSGYDGCFFEIFANNSLVFNQSLAGQGGKTLNISTDDFTPDNYTTITYKEDCRDNTTAPAIGLSGLSLVTAYYPPVSSSLASESYRVVTVAGPTQVIYEPTTLTKTTTRVTTLLSTTTVRQGTATRTLTTQIISILTTTHLVTSIGSPSFVSHGSTASIPLNPYPSQSRPIASNSKVVSTQTHRTSSTTHPSRHSTTGKSTKQTGRVLTTRVPASACPHRRTTTGESQCYFHPPRGLRTDSFNSHSHSRQDRLAEGISSRIVVIERGRCVSPLDNDSLSRPFDSTDRLLRRAPGKDLWRRVFQSQ